MRRKDEKEGRKGGRKGGRVEHTSCCRIGVRRQPSIFVCTERKERRKEGTKNVKEVKEVKDMKEGRNEGKNERRM